MPTATYHVTRPACGHVMATITGDPATEPAVRSLIRQCQQQGYVVSEIALSEVWESAQFCDCSKTPKAQAPVHFVREQ